MGTALRYIAFWALSIAIVVGPYFALRFGVPLLVARSPFASAFAMDRFLVALNLNYWWVMLVYIALAGIFTPKWDPDNLGLFGGYVDNPLTFEDYHNRAMRTLALFLFPGKFVWHTVEVTGRNIIDAMRGA